MPPICLAFGMLVLTLSFGVNAHMEHVQMHSIFPPILADFWENGLHYWSFGSSSVVTDDYVRLTTQKTTGKGYFWNRHPNHLDGFIANTTVRLRHRESQWFGDSTDGGMAIWYSSATPRHMPTPFFGNVDAFEGLGIVLDHSDTISVLLNDGERVGSLSNSRRGHCQIKNLGDRLLTITVMYKPSSKELGVSYHLWMDAQTPGTDNFCVGLSDVALPLRNYFGVTASNSEHARAEHDIISFFVKPSRADDDAHLEEEEVAGLHLFDHGREQQLQKEWNGRADEPLSKDRAEIPQNSEIEESS